MSRSNISNGPSKFDLSNALFIWGENRPSITFQLEGKMGIGIRCRVTGVEAEDGSGESWNISGHMHGGERFEAYYRTDTRKGFVERKPVHPKAKFVHPNQSKT